MTKSRVPETNTGIQGEFIVEEYDQMQRHLRDKGWIETGDIINSGITAGHALEIGHGPGYLGLEWLKKTHQTNLTGFDISPDMHALAKKNAKEYGLSDRTEYQLGNCNSLPFQTDQFDAVFSNGSLHEWENPIAAFDEFWRVLKSGGRYYISDLRRDMNIFMYWFLWIGTKPASIRPGLQTSIAAAYTPPELKALAQQSVLKDCVVTGNLVGLSISGIK